MKSSVFASATSAESSRRRPRAMALTVPRLTPSARAIFRCERRAFPQHATDFLNQGSRNHRPTPPKNRRARARIPVRRRPTRRHPTDRRRVLSWIFTASSSSCGLNRHKASIKCTNLQPYLRTFMANLCHHEPKKPGIGQGVGWLISPAAPVCVISMGSAGNLVPIRSTFGNKSRLRRFSASPPGVAETQHLMPSGVANSPGTASATSFRRSWRHRNQLWHKELRRPPSDAESFGARCAFLASAFPVSSPKREDAPRAKSHEPPQPPSPAHRDLEASQAGFHSDDSRHRPLVEESFDESLGRRLRDRRPGAS